MAEGLVAEIVGACSGGAVLTGWAIYLKSGPLLTGLVLALPQVAQVLQIPAAWTTSRFGSRRVAIWLVAVQRQIGLPLIALPFLPWSTRAQQSVLVTVALLAALLGVLGNNAWVSWMADLVPARIRGRYFGRRAAVCTLGGALASAAAGLVLDGAHGRGWDGHGLALLQALACASGVLSTVLMARQHASRKSTISTGTRHSLWRRALQPLCDRSVRGFLAYLLTWNAAIGIASSYFSLFMLRDLGMGFTLVAVQGAGVALVRMLAAPAWGSVIDRVGPRPVMVACSFGISAIPFIWLLPTPGWLWPLGIDCVLTGLLWSGHALAAFNLPLSVTPTEGRPFYLAVFATVAGATFALATAAGGLLARALPTHLDLCGHSIANLQVLFALSGGLRLVASLVALRIQHASSRDVMDVVRAARAVLPQVVRHIRRVVPRRAA
jgi:MFS family permease